MEETEKRLRKALSILYNDTTAQQAITSDSTPQDSLSFQSAFYALTRILLFHIWQNCGLITSYARDKAVDIEYEAVEREIDRVLEKTLPLANEPGWPSESHNQFNLYRPGDDALNETFEILSELDPSDMTLDALGNAYEDSLDHTGRRRGGQYYTTPEIISFIWDRAGLTNPSDFFRYDDGLDRPKLIFDPAVGSGGFLLEAAHRITAGLETMDTFEQLDPVKRAIGALHGSEIEPFPHYLAGINMLIQMTPLIKKLRDAGYPLQEGFFPTLLNIDALSLHDGDISPSRAKGESIENRNDFDFVCSNPPFIGEKGNKELFRRTLSKYPWWKEYYQGKMDYLYWFIILGLSKLREGGKLGFITSSYWPTADGAGKLRQYILSNAIIREIIDLGELSVFGDARGQHNMIFILERCNDESKRLNNPVKMARFKTKVNGGSNLKALLGHLSAHIDSGNHSDELVEVFTSRTLQGELDQKAWNLTDAPVMPGLTGRHNATVLPLGRVCRVSQGIISGADRVTQSNIKLLPGSLIKRHGIRTGDGIFVLSEDELQSLDLDAHERRIVKPLVKNSDIQQYHINRRSPLFLIYTTRETDIEEYPSIKAHLEKFRPVLESKRECREGKLPWFSLHWPRDHSIFEREKIVTPNRAPENTFALSEAALYGMSDIFFITSNYQKEELGYILAILNSRLMNQWFSSNGKPKGSIGEYVGTPLARIPVRLIDFDDPVDVESHNRMAYLARALNTANREEMLELQSEIDSLVTRLYGLKSAGNLLSWGRKTE